MSDNKDPAIKLFGKTIQLLSDDDTNVLVSHPQQTSSTQISSHDNQKHSGGELTETNQQDVSSHPPNASGVNEDPKTPCAEKEIPSSTTNKKDDPSEASNSEEKTLKKPDKLLPCPRCNSMDTKFCYYNNYNVNQPRYFCKNCQRYWTAGGTMRNVPVGSGRRKNKTSPSSHYHHIIVSEALHTARANAANGVHLSFGSDPHLCESMASALTLAEKSQRNVVSCGGGENREDFSSGSSSSASNPAEKGNNGGLREPISNNFSLPNPPPCFPGTPWPIPWNPAQWGYPMPSSPPPAFGPPGFPVSFYPVPQYWNVPWMPPQFTSLANSSLSSGRNSPTLGKHSRDGNMLTPSNSGIEVMEERELERGVLIPKTLRISDPSEAAKSSIWSTLGIKNDNSDSVGREGVLKAFQPKDNEKNHTAETSPMLQANPAALSRSLNFHEST